MDTTRIHTLPMPLTVDGRDFVIKIYPGEHYIGYFATRDGKQYGPERRGLATSRPGTMGRRVYDAVKAAGH